MRKKVGIIKRVSCLGLIFLLSINSFAAIVSDNDGSAFITKAEFDALKSSFQTQIDSYNQSIDSKIDGAIASYLSGIKLSTVEEFTPFFPVTAAGTNGIECVASDALKRAIPYDIGLSIHCTFGRTTSGMFSINPLDGSARFITMDTKYSTQPENVAFKTRSEAPDIVSNIYSKQRIELDGGFFFMMIGAAHTQWRLWLARRTGIKIGTLFDWNNPQGMQCDPTDDSRVTSIGTDSGTTKTPTWCGSYFGAANLELNEDKNIYLFNKCDCSNIICYADSDNELELFTDTLTNTDSLSIVKYNKATSVSVRMCSDTGMSNASWIYFVTPKYRLKQQAAINKGVSGGYSNLNQLRNGALQFVNTSGVNYAPKYYEGLPLFNTSKDTEETTFKITLDYTIGAVSTMKVWLKDGPFVNSDDFSSTAWATEKTKLVQLSAEGCTTNSDGSLSIPTNVKTTIKATNLQKGKTYYLRFCENGRTYGGKINYLYDFSHKYSQ